MMLFLDTGSAAAWSSFGLILAVLVAFTAHYYWKKNKETSGKIPVPTSDGYDNLSFQKVLDENKELKGKLKEEEQEHNELKIEHAALLEREKSLNSNNQTLTNELNQLREKHDFFQDQNTKLEKEKSELIQQVITKEDRLKEKGDRLLERQTEIKDLMDHFSDLEEELKDLKVDNKKLSTEKLNLSDRNDRLERELEKFKKDYQILQTTEKDLLKSKAELTEQKKNLEEKNLSLEKQYTKSWNFYETLRDKGIEVDVETLLHYKEFHTKHKKFIEAEERKKEKEQGSIAKGKEYELSWKDDLREQFTEKEWEFIDIVSQPGVGDGKRGDYKVSFRDSEKSSTSINQLHIYVEHKYTQEAKNTVGEPNAEKHKQMDDDLKKAFESVSKGGDYDFIFLITNREIGQERFREKGFFWISSDKDYQSFGLTPPARIKKKNQQVKPAIIIMTRAKSFEFLWNFYTLWKNWSSHNVIQEPDMLVKKINEVFSSEEFKKGLIKWINESDQFNLEIGEKMEKQWHVLMERLRIISDFWSKKKKQAYSLNREAIKLRNNVEWSTVEEEDSSNSQSIGESNSSEKEENEVLISGQFIKENAVSEITSKVNIEQPEVRDNLFSSI